VKQRVRWEERFASQEVWRTSELPCHRLDADVSAVERGADRACPRGQWRRDSDGTISKVVLVAVIINVDGSGSGNTVSWSLVKNFTGELLTEFRERTKYIFEGRTLAGRSRSATRL